MGYVQSLGFHGGTGEVPILRACGITSVDDQRMFKMSNDESLDIKTLRDMSTILSQNARHQSTSDTAPHPGRRETSLVKIFATEHCQVL